jgi:hypothetical protein
MIEYRDLLALAMWCQSQGFSWLPGRSEQGCEALVLEKPGHRTESLLLLHDSHGYCLIDPLGELLVSASDLTVLLDALDGGIADSTRSVMADSAVRRKPRLRAA